jgi:hypothetical protein
VRDDVVGGESRSRCFSKTFRCDVVTCDVAMCDGMPCVTCDVVTCDIDTCVACDGIPCVTCNVFTGDVLTTVALNRSMSTELRLLKLGINLNRKCKTVFILFQFSVDF